MAVVVASILGVVPTGYLAGVGKIVAVVVMATERPWTGCVSRVTTAAFNVSSEDPVTERKYTPLTVMTSAGGSEILKWICG